MARAVAKATRQTERELSRQVKDFLRLDGWRVLRQEPLSRAGGGRYAGELGMPDLLALRYADHRVIIGAKQSTPDEILWIEVKSHGAKPKPHQAAWHAAERALGAEVWVVDDLDEFRGKYIDSGLNRSMR